MFTRETVKLIAGILFMLGIVIIFWEDAKNPNPKENSTVTRVGALLVIVGGLLSLWLLPS